MANKRGRKRVNDLYFGPEQEEAVVKFLESSDDRERNAIYNKWLKDPFDKMIESIIRKYKLYRKGISFEDLHADTLSFLITKADKFDKDSGNKAYSYYGTICKRYIIGLLIKDDKSMKQLYSYDDLTESYLDERDDLQYVIDDDELSLDKLFDKILDGLKLEMDTYMEHPNLKKRLSENEVKIGYALIEMIENRKLILDKIGGGGKFYRNAILETMRNYTNMSTKDIRSSMKRYTSIYEVLKLDALENGFE
jgi:hypothetical protein